MPVPTPILPATVAPEVLFAALILDYLVADPWSWYHPVQAMGSVIQFLTRLSLTYTTTPLQRWLAGGGMTGILVLGSAGYAWGLVQWAESIHPLVGFWTHSVLLASCLGARSLHFAAWDVLEPLEKGDLEAARGALRHYVGRDTEQLDETEICRALIETVAENTPDGGTGPLFYGVIGGAPLAFAYKAASTLDSMVGYRRDPYTHLGTVAARLEDALTWLPCRLTVLTLAWWSSNSWSFWQSCGRDARQDSSPNSGWSEAAYAYWLGVQLGGTNVYQGIPTEKPRLGVPTYPLTPRVVRQSLRILRLVMISWIAVTGLVLGIVGWLY